MAEKVKITIPVDFMIYLKACIYFICEDTWRTNHAVYSSDLIHGLDGKSSTVLEFWHGRCFLSSVTA